MEPCKVYDTTQLLVSRTGAGRQGKIFSFRSREKNVLDFSSYRSGFFANHRAVYDLLMTNQKASKASAISEQEKLSLDDANGNCKQCGHPFNPHIVLTYDTKDLSKGGEVRCPVAGCGCFHSLDFDLRDFKTV